MNAGRQAPSAQKQPSVLPLGHVFPPLIIHPSIRPPPVTMTLDISLFSLYSLFYLLIETLII